MCVRPRVPRHYLQGLKGVPIVGEKEKTTTISYDATSYDNLAYILIAYHDRHETVGE